MVLVFLVCTFIKTGNPHFFKCYVRLNQNYSIYLGYLSYFQARDFAYQLEIHGIAIANWVVRCWKSSDHLDNYQSDIILWRLISSELLKRLNDGVHNLLCRRRMVITNNFH